MPLPKVSKLLFIFGLAVLLLSLPLAARAVVQGEQNDFVKDVNEGKQDLNANPSAKADVDEVGKNETETADDEDNSEIEDKDAQGAPDQAEPAKAPESEDSTNGSGSDASTNR